MTRRPTRRQAPTGLTVPMPVEDAVMKVRGLTKVYGSGDTAVRALNHVNVDIERGRFTAIMGPSGSGKSTFMHCLAGFESITSGSVLLDGIEIAGMSERKLTQLRRDNVGFIFQSFNLIPTLTAAENIRLPQDIAHKPNDEGRFTTVVEALGLRDRLDHRPAELSGGQQQRIACARALMQSPTVLFADEPTGNLDSRSTEQVLTYLRRAVDDFGQTVVMVTHESQAAAYADTVLFLTDGEVVASMDYPTNDDILDALSELEARMHGEDPVPRRPREAVRTPAPVPASAARSETMRPAPAPSPAETARAQRRVLAPAPEPAPQRPLSTRERTYADLDRSDLRSDLAADEDVLETSFDLPPWRDEDDAARRAPDRARDVPARPQSRREQARTGAIPYLDAGDFDEEMDY